MNQGGEDRISADMTIIRKPIRSARLQVRPDGSLRVVAPPSFDVGGFLRHNAAWIKEQRDEFDRLAAEGRGREEQLLLHGEFYRLIPGARFEVDRALGSVICPSILALRRNLSGILKKEVADHLKVYPDLVGQRSGRIAVKLQRTRWGSCSSLGNLNFNLRVVALPDPLREYIIVHEAAHLREQNHSERFWRLVEKHYPEYQAAEVELRRYWVILERNRVWGSIQRTK